MNLSPWDIALLRISEFPPSLIGFWVLLFLGSLSNTVYWIIFLNSKGFKVEGDGVNIKSNKKPIQILTSKQRVQVIFTISLPLIYLLTIFYIVLFTDIIPEHYWLFHLIPYATEVLSVIFISLFIFLRPPKIN